MNISGDVQATKGYEIILLLGAKNYYYYVKNYFKKNKLFVTYHFKVYSVFYFV